MLIQNNQNTPDSSDSPCSIEQHIHNYEDTESEYACELRRQTYLQKIGKTSFFFKIIYRAKSLDLED